MEGLSNIIVDEFKISGVEAHNSLGIGEGLHEPLRRIYRKISVDFPYVQHKRVLKMAVKSINDSIGENGLEQSRIVFGMIITILLIIFTELQNKNERNEIFSNAQMEMNAMTV